MGWRQRTVPWFEFTYRGQRVLFDPTELDVAVDFTMNIYVDGVPVELDREESMRFMRAYCAWLDRV